MNESRICESANGECASHSPFAIRHSLFAICQEQGQTIIEFVLTLPLLLLVVYIIAIAGWHWWTQVTVSTAVHDGVQAAARTPPGGYPLVEGRREAEGILYAALGRSATPYRDNLRLHLVPQRRGVYGELEYSHTAFLLGRMTEKASSFQRAEQFYGGGPIGGTWEGEYMPWE